MKLLIHCLLVMTVLVVSPANITATTVIPAKGILAILPPVGGRYDSSSEKSRMSIEMKNVPLKEVLHTIAGLYDIEFRIPAGLAEHPVTAVFHEASYRTVAQSVAEQVGLKPEFDGAHVILH